MKINRNSSCPCGSGRKYKKCCIRASIELPSIEPRAKENIATLNGWNYSHHAVAFLDLMGQRKSFEGISGVPNSPEEKTRLYEALRNTVGYIQLFRNGF